MPDFSYADPAVLAFVVIPLALAVGLIVAVAYAWRRAGEPVAETARATLLMAAGTAAWMGLTWVVAERGIFRQWDRIPPSAAVLTKPASSA